MGNQGEVFQRKIARERCRTDDWTSSARIALAAVVVGVAVRAARAIVVVQTLAAAVARFFAERPGIVAVAVVEALDAFVVATDREPALAMSVGPAFHADRP